MLSDVGMLECRSTDSQMDVNTKLLPDQGSFLRVLGGTGDWSKTELSDSNQTGHHVLCQCSKPIFISPKNYTLGGGKENFKIPRESSRGRVSLFR